jgi:uncharacterized protein YwgA
MEAEGIFQILVALAIVIGGWFFKRIFTLLDRGQRKMNHLEVDMAAMKAVVDETHQRLDRIEEKLDRLLQR